LWQWLKWQALEVTSTLWQFQMPLVPMAMRTQRVTGWV
jgi:hypothetical protein